MAFKINLSEKSGKTYKLEVEAPLLEGKLLHDKINGKDISDDLEGYEFEITGASDKSGFTAVKEVDGSGLKKVLLSYEKGMHKRPKREGKKKRSNFKPKGLRLRKTVRGKIISDAISQINLKTLKDGKKPFAEIFPEQNKAPEKKEAKKKE
ncbi:MAG TPA: S6e family ribosomal protein [Candidatus Nanoarchaeia archaeon]|nr:S6e family ribosomal protein [Candidatus Nanoarchaeia archaeon]